MRLTLLASTGLAVILIAAGPAAAKGKSGGSHPTQHVAADNTGSGDATAATQADGDDATASSANYLGSHRPDIPNYSVARGWSAATVNQEDARGATITKDDDGTRKTLAATGTAVHGHAGKDKAGNPTANSGAFTASEGKSKSYNSGKKRSVSETATASASATGGKVPKAAANAQTGKEHVHVDAVAGGKVDGTGGKQIILHPKPNETVVIEYTRHTEGVAVSLPHRAEAYAAAAAKGHVYYGQTLIAAAYAAAYAFAEGWNNGAYAYSAGSGSAYARAGSDSSGANVEAEAEAAIWQGSILHIKLPPLPKVHVKPDPPGADPENVNDPRLGGIEGDPPFVPKFCMAKKFPTGQWGLACASAGHMPSQAEITARLHQGWTEIIAGP